MGAINLGVVHIYFQSRRCGKIRCGAEVGALYFRVDFGGVEFLWWCAKNFPPKNGIEGLEAHLSLQYNNTSDNQKAIKNRTN